MSLRLVVMGLLACGPTVQPPPEAPPTPLPVPIAIPTPVRDSGVVSIAGGEPEPIREVEDASVPRFSAVVAITQMRPKLRRCYERSLASTPGLTGGLVFDLTIAADGTVTSIVTKQNTLPLDLTVCLEKTLRSLLVEAPETAPLKLSVPLRFVPPATP